MLRTMNFIVVLLTLNCARGKRHKPSKLALFSTRMVSFSLCGKELHRRSVDTLGSFLVLRP